MNTATRVKALESEVEHLKSTTMKILQVYSLEMRVVGLLGRATAATFTVTEKQEMTNLLDAMDVILKEK